MKFHPLSADILWNDFHQEVNLMAGEFALRGVPASGYSAPVAMVTHLNNAQREPLPAKDINPAAMWFAGHVPVHEAAVPALCKIDAAQLKKMALGPDGQALLNETDMNINVVRRFLDSDGARHAGLPSIVSAAEFNARFADRTVAIPAIFQKDSVPASKGKERFLSGGIWWTVGFMGISERYSVTLPLSFHVGKYAYIRAVESIAHTAEKYSSEITIRNAASGSPSISAKSLLGILALGIAPGNQITIETEGPDSKKAIGAMTRRIHALERMSKTTRASRK